MKPNKKQYWKGIDQLTNDPEFVRHAEKEFPDYLPYNAGRLEDGEGSSRRDFLKMMGFSLAAASLAACEAPVRKAIPYLNKPVEVDPGIPNYYASTYVNGGDYCSVLVKTREGRPIKIEPNKLSTVTGAGTSAQAQASVLSLYDKQRLTAPYINDQEVSWESVDAQIRSKLESISSGGGAIRIVSKTVLSPSTRRVIEQFTQRYPGASLVEYDPVSAYGMVKANTVSFGRPVIPQYHFDRAKVIVGFSADFLGTWINPVQYSADFAVNRKLGRDKQDMSRLYMYESNLSLTGANADYRVPVKPSQEGAILIKLYNLLATKTGRQAVAATGGDAPHIEQAANDLWKYRGQCLVIAGSNDPDVQVLVNAINALLGNNENVIDLNTPVYYRQGNDDQMASFVEDLKGGKIGGVVFLNCNPVYDHRLGAEIRGALENANLRVSISERRDETAVLVDYLAPDHHYLESWNDACPVEGSYSLAQPTISPLFNTRQAQVSLLKWAGEEPEDYYSYLKAYWQEHIYPIADTTEDFQSFWDRCLHDGVFELKRTDGGEKPVFAGDVADAAQGIASHYKNRGDGLELVLYETIGMGDGTHANNPWLQEMPDPVTKSTWDNYLTISQSMANALGIDDNATQLVQLTVGGISLTLPALVQPGQAAGTVGLAIGYGRTAAGPVGDGIGVNAYPLLGSRSNLSMFSVLEGVSVTGTGTPYKIARTQTHHTFMNRDFVIQEATLSDYQKDPYAGRHMPKIHVSNALEKKLGDGDLNHKVPPRALSLWKGHAYPNHHWAMAIDMNSCTGCSACTVACQVENNVPVVGREEVLNRREMAWLRIDRYYSSAEGAETYNELEQAAENPEVTFQPMLCQHCNNAPCETVCPVAATTHSTEGLNQMTYNRCIGTRYCANNCPYKVRRFNWFKYHDNQQFDANMAMNNDLGKMVLNPDVTVRSRGVMEKCTFCVQRIQYGKLEAKKEKRRPRDGEVVTACASACPTEAIVFGDIKDPESKVSKLLRFRDEGDWQQVDEPRAYHVLEDINVKPNIWYMTKIRNKDES
jgi:molybdopterin-containing oxidoreductase family iron-sulfur binding subunit